MKFVRSLIIAALVAVTPAIAFAQTAQTGSTDLKGFWRKGDVTDWKSSVQPNSSTAVVYRDYPATVDDVKLRVQRETEEAVQNAQKTQDLSQNVAASVPGQPSVPLSREQIIAKYGSPEQPSAIRAQKDSPVEMQALFEALNSGDKELAWQYSVALAKRDAEIQRTVSKVTDYRLLASEALGERPATEINPETDEVGATRMELKELIERTRLEQAKKKISDDSLIGTTTMPHATGDEWAQQGQPAAAQVASSKIPVDPAGKVKVLIFFNEKGLRVNEFAKSLKPLQEKFKNDPKVSMVGLTMRTYALPGLKKLGAMTSFPFPLVNGEALAPELRIQRYPTFVFLAETSKETYHLEGERGVEEVERVLNVMKGSSK
jgi:hypothetical protein